MERAHDMLMALFRKAISEQDAGAPELVGIDIVEGITEPSELSLVAEFCNGYRTSAPLSALNFYEFCERHATWDLPSLRSALCAEGQKIYARMVRAHEGVTSKQEAQAHADPCNGIPLQRNPPTSNGICHRLQAWWRRRTALFERDALASAEHREAHARGHRLLMQNLSPMQRQKYLRCGYFDVIGGATGKRYLIMNGHQLNVYELDGQGHPARVLCFMPRGGLVGGDVLLAQKLAVELFEPEARGEANMYPYRGRDMRRW
jgi:hypothetical protein